MKDTILTIALLILFTASMVLLFSPRLKSYDQSKYLTRKVLDSARPLNVKINLEFLKDYKPAYEQ